MEYVNGGDLFDYIVDSKKLTEDLSRRLFRQLVSAIMYCHENMIVHRGNLICKYAHLLDLKPENLLMDANQNLKIIDFGFVRTYMRDPNENLKTYCGSLYYCAPEMIDGTPYYGPAVDIWSMGIILYVFLNGYLPFRETNAANLYESIRTATFEDGEYASAGKV